MDLLEIIKADSDFVEKVGAVCNIDLYSEANPPQKIYEKLVLSIDGKPFAYDGGGGVYVFLTDKSIGYVGAEGECGRIAENLKELFELLLNCNYDWYNYSRKILVKSPSLFEKHIKQQEEMGKEEFYDAYGDDLGDFDDLKIEIASKLDLNISKNIINQQQGSPFTFGKTQKQVSVQKI